MPAQGDHDGSPLRDGTYLFTMMQNIVALTQSKAGRRFMGFMKTLNSGDDAQIKHAVESYITEESLEKHGADVWTAQMQYIHAISGGLRVMQVIGAEEYHVVVLMQAHKDERLHILEMYVSEDYPHKISAFIQRVQS